MKRKKRIKAGDKIAKLMVLFKINPIPEKDNRRKTPSLREAFLCICECGNLKAVKANLLISKAITSCGECAGDKKHPKIITAHHLYAKRYNDGDLTFDDFYKLSQMNCYYCGKEPSQSFNYHTVGKRRTSAFAKANGEFIYNGLDRVNNSLPHNKDNLVPCCKICNFAKRDMTVEDFKNWVISAYKHWGSK